MSLSEMVDDAIIEQRQIDEAGTEQMQLEVQNFQNNRSSENRIVSKELYELFQDHEMKPKERKYEIDENGIQIPKHSKILDGRENPMSSLKLFDHVLVWPVLCTCGFNTGHVGPLFHKMVRKGLTPDLAMNLVEATRLCCRTTLMSPTTHLMTNRCAGTVDQIIFEKCKSSTIKYTNLSSELDRIGLNSDNSPNSAQLREGDLNCIPFSSHDSSKIRYKTVKGKEKNDSYLEPEFKPFKEGKNPDAYERLSGKIPKSLTNIEPPDDSEAEGQLRFSKGWAKDENGNIIMTHVGNNYFVPQVRLGVSNVFKFVP